MADTHDNRARVTIGGDEYTLVASNRASWLYGKRFRNDVGALDESGVWRDLPMLDEDGAPMTDEHGKIITSRQQLGYSGSLSLDIAISAQAPVPTMLEVPLQVVAATWAMLRASGDTEEDFDSWLAWWWSLPISAAEQVALWEAVCVDLSERAFFRDFGGPADAGQPDEVEG